MRRQHPFTKGSASGMSHSGCKNCVRLRGELEALKEEFHTMQLNNYWRFNNINYLRIELCATNEILPQLRCDCSLCNAGGYCRGWRRPHASKVPVNEDKCRFRPWFLSLLEEVGLSFCSEADNNGSSLAISSREEEVHLVIPSESEALTLEEGALRYGGRTKNARFQSADLKLLDRLFEALAQKQDACRVV